MNNELTRTAEAIERYIEGRFFDPQGLLYSYVDAVTGQPLEPSLLTPEKAPRRAQFDPWSYWTYEDTVQCTGMYLDALVRKHVLTGEKAALERAAALWSSLRNIYYCSQAFGIGSFLRPYGGYERMSQWVEPLGTDQASPTFAGSYLYMKHVGEAQRAEMSDILLKSLTWYEQQGFQYFYYKCFIHEWSTVLQHAASYYVPAIAWALRQTGDPKWERYLQLYLGRLEKGPVALEDSYKKYNLYRSFYWGGDLAVLQECLGERFGEFITPLMIEHAYELALADLARNYCEPGLLKRYHPESAKPGFEPYVDPHYDRRTSMGFAYFSTVHQGRSRPRLEMHALCGLAALGHRGAYEKALELMALRKTVPYDFTDLLFEDHDQLPPEVHLFARAVGAILFEWYRDYWLLRGLSERR